jgi:hypothetical protein
VDSKFKQLEAVLTVVVALVTAYFFRHLQWLLTAALGLGLAGLLSPVFRRLFYRGWMGLAELMGKVTGKILLTIVYILLLVPIAFIARSAGKVGLRRKSGGSSTFTVRDHIYEREDMLHPW